MKNASQVICLFSSLVWLGLGAPVHSNPQSADDPPENFSTAPKPGHPIMAQEPEINYAMKIIKPSPNIDYKIVYVTPDPGIDYKIRNLGPKFGIPFMRENGWYGGTDRKSIPRK